MNLFDLLINKTKGKPAGGAAQLEPTIEPVTISDTTQPSQSVSEDISFAPLVKDPYADNSGYRKSGRMASGAAPTYNELSLKQKMGRKLGDALLGKQAESTDSVGDMQATISKNPRSGGILRDFASGYQENRFNPLSIDNFGQKTLIDGRNKGFAYRLGEGLGSLVRFGESPLGRSLLVAGAVGLTGGNPLQMMAFGTSTGMQNQANRMRDKAYRQDLIDYAQQTLRNQEGFNELSPEEQTQVLQNMEMDEAYKNLTDKEAKNKMLSDAQSQYLKNRQEQQLNSVADRINAYRGYLDNDTYNNMMQAQQLRDNAAYRKMYFDTQQTNLEAQREWQRQQAEYAKQQDAINNQLKREQIQQQAADRAADRDFKYYSTNLAHNDRIASIIANNQPKTNPLSDSQVNTISQMDSAIEDMNRIIKTYSSPQYNSYFGASGFIKRNPITGRFDPIVSQMSQDIDLMRKTVAKAKEGGRLTDQDQKYYEKALMNPNLTQDKFIQLAKRFQDTQIKQRDIVLKNYAKAGKDITNFVREDNGYQSVGKYKVRVK